MMTSRFLSLINETAVAALPVLSVVSGIIVFIVSSVLLKTLSRRDFVRVISEATKKIDDCVNATGRELEAIVLLVNASPALEREESIISHYEQALRSAEETKILIDKLLQPQNEVEVRGSEQLKRMQSKIDFQIEQIRRAISASRSRISDLTAGRNRS